MWACHPRKAGWREHLHVLRAKRLAQRQASRTQRAPDPRARESERTGFTQIEQLTVMVYALYIQCVLYWKSCLSTSRSTGTYEYTYCKIVVSYSTVLPDSHHRLSIPCRTYREPPTEPRCRASEAEMAVSRASHATNSCCEWRLCRMAVARPSRAASMPRSRCCHSASLNSSVLRSSIIASESVACTWTVFKCINTSLDAPPSQLAYLVVLGELLVLALERTRQVLEIPARLPRQCVALVSLGCCRLLDELCAQTLELLRLRSHIRVYWNVRWL